MAGIRSGEGAVEVRDLDRLVVRLSLRMVGGAGIAAVVGGAGPSAELFGAAGAVSTAPVESLLRERESGLAATGAAGAGFPAAAERMEPL